MVENEEIRNRQLGNDGDSPRPGNNSLNHDEKQLENLITKQSYAEYRASLKDTRFTKLSEVQAFNFSHAKYVNEPETSIWGEVQSSFRINNGIFEVSTASHGGIMIKSDIARIGSTERELAAAISAAMNDNVAEQNESSALNKAKELINDFCEHEYLSSADFNDLHNVSLAYTTLTEHELPVQVTADLIDFKIIYEFNGEVYDNEKFNDLDDMVNNGLTGISFDELVSVPDDVIEQHTQELESSAERNKDTYMLLSRCSRDCEYVINNSDMMDKLESINKHLYGGSIESCISTMREQYNKLSDDDKPEWLSAEDIDGYRRVREYEATHGISEPVPA